MTVLFILEYCELLDGMAIMYATIIIALWLSTIIQTNYICLVKKSNFLHTFKMIFAMVFVSMLGMFAADIFLHSQSFDHSAHQHHLNHSMQMFQMMLTPVSILSMVLGGIIPLLPYNYYQLKKYGKQH